MTKEQPRALSPTIYSVSYQDMVDIWLDTMHPNDNVVVVWDAVNHKDLLRSAGFQLDEGALYNNKILTIVLDDIRDCFYVLDVIKSYKDHPYTQVYTAGRLLTDDIQEIEPELN